MNKVTRFVYCIYDVVARQVITTFQSDNDEKAVRDCSYRVHLSAPLSDLYLYKVGEISYDSEERYMLSFTSYADKTLVPWSDYDLLVEAPNLAEAQSTKEAQALFNSHLKEVAKAQKKVLEEQIN